ncbi:alpha/beta fold hydrolase [Cumulibacter soli]|uniref:alpha/beta fold hydrolase n=1 Tax=Cumulibacter soli TaxID=2546344 RepID=UPI001067759B|nr:alpha/beta hydrolase [Cumulibacter soli]
MLSHRDVSLTDHSAHLVDVDGGPRTPLLLLHGGAVDHRMWQPQLSAFSDRRVIAPDARGHGSTADASGPYRLVDDVARLLDALEIAQVVIAGVSMGGGTAVDVALEYPERCTGLIVTGTGTSEPDFVDPWALDAFETWNLAATEGNAQLWIDTFMRFTYGPHRTRADLDRDVVAHIEMMAQQTISEHVTLDDNGVPTPPIPPTPVTNTWARVRHIIVPTLALNGADDGPDHLSNARRLAQNAPQGQYVEIAGAAHYPNLERPAEYNELVRHFLDTNGI